MVLLSGILLVTIFSIVSSRSIFSNDPIYGQPEQVHISYGRMLNYLKVTNLFFFFSYQCSRSITYDSYMGNIESNQ